ncbi:DUF3302 domain-containing protein [Vibrio splendidus]|uniref:DUF3302 domain-containing protein n=1 Tax=Vibrio splendidus TaxID=29497 RepID=UPI003D0B5F61
MTYIERFTSLELAALGVLSFVVLFTTFIAVKICSLPYDIARKRNHKHQEAILVAGWVSLFTLHAIWPCLWIWAMLDGTSEKEG